MLLNLMSTEVVMLVELALEGDMEEEDMVEEVLELDIVEGLELELDILEGMEEEELELEVMEEEELELEDMVEAVLELELGMLEAVLDLEDMVEEELVLVPQTSSKVQHVPVILGNPLTLPNIRKGY